MRTLLVVLITALACAGCGEAEKAAGMGIDIQIDAGQKAAATAAKAMLDRELRAFQGEHARFPESLDELAESRAVRIPTLPLHGRWDYDPETGTVSAKFN